MTFNFFGFWRFLVRWLSSSGWSAQRLAIAIAFLLIFPILELWTRIGFLVDHLFWGRFRRQPVESPVFIVGNFRSGTTFLHRLLAQDKRRFATMTLGEIMFAPSILQRKVIRALAMIDRWLGAPLDRALSKEEARWDEVNPTHKVSLRQPEEDDYLLLHIFRALTIWMNSGLLEDARTYLHFDTRLPESTKDLAMAFYRRCVQRFLFDRGGGFQYLAKNPALSPKLDTLFRHFPDACVVYLARSPLETVPSFLSMTRLMWGSIGNPIHTEELNDFTLEMTRHWYEYPLERLAEEPDDRYAVLRYEDLVNDPEGTVRGIYERFGFDIGPDFEEVLRRETSKARKYRSRHRYDLEELGLTQEQIAAECNQAFERFDFDIPDLPDPAAQRIPVSAR